MGNQMQAFAACPKCGKSGASAVGFTWWGGLLGPKLFNVVKCGGCATQYNGKSGKMNTTNIVIYSVVIGIAAIALVIFASSL